MKIMMTYHIVAL